MGSSVYEYTGSSFGLKFTANNHTMNNSTQHSMTPLSPATSVLSSWYLSNGAPNFVRTNAAKRTRQEHENNRADEIAHKKLTTYINTTIAVTKDETQNDKKHKRTHDDNVTTTITTSLKKKEKNIVETELSKQMKEEKEKKYTALIY